MNFMFKFFAAISGVAMASTSLALEYPIGAPQQKNGMEIAAVYLQPVEMEPAGMMRAAKDSDVHMEADIHALANNPNGFDEGAWMPYLMIKYEITKVGSDFKIGGDFMPMVASDGPHYGDNIQLAGPGKYRLSYFVSAPSANPHSHFGRHTDRETGVGEWFQPFKLDYEFTYAGIGKKGGY